MNPPKICDASYIKKNIVSSPLIEDLSYETGTCSPWRTVSPAKIYQYLVIKVVVGARHPKYFQIADNFIRAVPLH